MNKRLRMFKLVTGEQVIAMSEAETEKGWWILHYPYEVVRTGMYSRRDGRSGLGGPWVVGVSDVVRAKVPLEFKFAILVYYEGDIDPGLADDYARAYARDNSHGK